jgi:hypothetical protein
MTQKRVVPIDGSTVSHYAIITLAIRLSCSAFASRSHCQVSSGSLIDVASLVWIIAQMTAADTRGAYFSGDVLWCQLTTRYLLAAFLRGVGTVSPG